MFWININNIYANATTKAEYYFPKIVWAFIIIILWVLVSVWIYKFVMYIFRRFKIIEFIDNLNIEAANSDKKDTKKIPLRKRISDKIKVDEIVAKAFSYYMFLVFFRLSITVIGIQEIEDFLADLLTYLPSLFIAIIIGFFWVRFANFIHNVVYHALNLSKQKTAKIIASWAKIIILFFTLMAVLNKVGIANEITNTILIWFISMLALAWWLAFWLWGKDIAHEILESFRK